MAPLIIAERRIILFLVSFIAGIICFHQLDHSALHGRHFFADHCRGVFCHCGVVDYVYLDLGARAVYLPPVMTAKQLLSYQWWRRSTRAEQQKHFIILHKE